MKNFLKFVATKPLNTLTKFTLNSLFSRKLSRIGGPNDRKCGGERCSGTCRTCDKRNDKRCKGKDCNNCNRRRTCRKRQGDFVFSLLILTSCVVGTSNEVVRSRVRLIHQFLLRGFNVTTGRRNRRVLLGLFRRRGHVNVRRCHAIVRSDYRRVHTGVVCRRHLRLLGFLIVVTRTSGIISPRRVRTLGRMTLRVKLRTSSMSRVLNVRNNNSSTASTASLRSTCHVLNISPSTSGSRIGTTCHGVTLGRRPSGMTTLNRSIHHTTRGGFRRVGSTGSGVCGTENV